MQLFDSLFYPGKFVSFKMCSRNAMKSAIPTNCPTLCTSVLDIEFELVAKLNAHSVLHQLPSFWLPVTMYLVQNLHFLCCSVCTKWRNFTLCVFTSWLLPLSTSKLKLRVKAKCYVNFHKLFFSHWMLLLHGLFYSCACHIYLSWKFVRTLPIVSFWNTFVHKLLYNL